MELFERLKVLRKEIADEMNYPAFVVMSDKTLHALATDMPTTLEAFGNTFGIGEHKRDTYGKRFVEVIKQYTPEETELPFKEATVTSVPPVEPKEENEKKQKNQITILGKTYVIDADIWKSIEWRKVLKEITERAYWNHQGPLEIHLSEYVASDTQHRDRIIAMLCRLLKEGYGMNVDKQTGVVSVAQKFDYDKDGQLVAFPSGTFDVILSRFRLFVIQNKRYPLMDGEHDEIALRKWFREVGHGLVQITDEQKILFDNLGIEFADVPKNRSQVEKIAEKEAKSDGEG
jgi:ATP-dependent DNA helicase RecQ